ncbi:diguanylate cyclase domain-containing protein [Ideonella livida]|uniref:Diguanylate cyclase n=1 Tax=Ideonella livida TaxID=2707176 RepID=A0A7C9PFM9_9BURK|nr:diguanylate cyclase [Ideonella livida]NDY90411.1 diguanylate cyclase [Ideonella livida]
MHAPKSETPALPPVLRVLLVDDMPAIHEDFRKILLPAPPSGSAPAAVPGSPVVDGLDTLDALEASLFAAPTGAAPAAPAAAPKLRPATFLLDSAYQGQEALQKVETAVQEGRPYALAFVDMRMPPGWDGVETLEHLWRVDPALQVVICTAYSDYAWETVLERLQAQDRLIILKKPFDPIEVSQLAHTLCAKWLAAAAVARHTRELEEQVALRTAELQQANAQLQDELAERVRREADLQLAASVFRNALNGIVVTDERSCILSVNPAFTQLTGYEAHEAVGQRMSLLSSDHHPAGYYRAHWQALLAHGHWSGELWNRRKDGSLFCEWLSLSRVPAAPGQPDRYVGIMADVTERRRLDEHFRHLALHDPLTGLANRVRLEACVAEALTLAQAGAEGTTRQMALLFIDLDRFKPINDDLGHEAGDAVLRVVAERLTGIIRQGDTAARLGGDEFVLLLRDLRGVDDALQAAQRTLASLLQPIWLDRLVGPPLQIGASIGVACGPLHGTDAATLLRHADVAMYAAKAAGREQVVLFSPVEDPATHI